MPNRIIKDSIKHSKTINDLSWFEEVCFYRLLVTVDDFGCYYRDSQILKSELFPRKGDLTVKSIEDALVTIERASLIKSYWVAGEQYLQITTWQKHQRTRATKRKFPPPPDDCQTVDSNPRSIDSELQKPADNGGQMLPYSYSYSDSDSKCAGAREEGFMTDEEAAAIQADQTEILNRAEYIGMKPSPKEMDDLMDLMGKYGKAAVLYALDEASEHKAISLAYITKVAQNFTASAPESDSEFGEFEWAE